MLSVVGRLFVEGLDDHHRNRAAEHQVEHRDLPKSEETLITACPMATDGRPGV